MIAGLAPVAQGSNIKLPLSNIEDAAKVLGGTLAKAVEYLTSPEGQALVIEGLVALDDLLMVIGLFVPPVAVAANDIKIGIVIYQDLERLKPILIAIGGRAQADDDPSKPNVFGYPMDALFS